MREGPDIGTRQALVVRIFKQAPTSGQRAANPQLKLGIIVSRNTVVPQDNCCGVDRCEINSGVFASVNRKAGELHSIGRHDTRIHHALNRDVLRVREIGNFNRASTDIQSIVGHVHIQFGRTGNTDVGSALFMHRDPPVAINIVFENLNRWIGHVRVGLAGVQA